MANGWTVLYKHFKERNLIKNVFVRKWNTLIYILPGVSAESLNWSVSIKLDGIQSVMQSWDFVVKSAVLNEVTQTQQKSSILDSLGKTGRLKCLCLNKCVLDCLSIRWEWVAWGLQGMLIFYFLIFVYCVGKQDAAPYRFWHVCSVPGNVTVSLSFIQLSVLRRPPETQWLM